MEQLRAIGPETLWSVMGLVPAKNLWYAKFERYNRIICKLNDFTKQTIQQGA